MQSLTRAISRGNAVLIFNSVHRRFEPIYRKGTELKIWFRAKKERSIELENNFIQSNSKPFVREGEKVIKRRRKR